MPSLRPGYRFFQPVTSTSDQFVNAATGSLSVRAGEGASAGSADAHVGDTFTLPGDVVAVNVYSTIRVDFECSAWAAFFGGSSSNIDVGISLFNNRTDSGQVLQNCRTSLAWANAWVGTHGPNPNPGVATLALRCSADWGQPTGQPSVWTVAVSLYASTSADGWAGARARASTVVSRIDYELLWPV
jgi:hypothetical protein